MTKKSVVFFVLQSLFFATVAHARRFEQPAVVQSDSISPGTIITICVIFFGAIGAAWVAHDFNKVNNKRGNSKDTIDSNTYIEMAHAELQEAILQQESVEAMWLSVKSSLKEQQFLGLNSDFFTLEDQIWNFDAELQLYCKKHNIKLYPEIKDIELADLAEFLRSKGWARRLPTEHELDYYSGQSQSPYLAKHFYERACLIRRKQDQAIALADRIFDAKSESLELLPHVERMFLQYGTIELVTKQGLDLREIAGEEYTAAANLIKYIERHGNKYTQFANWVHILRHLTGASACLEYNAAYYARLTAPKPGLLASALERVPKWRRQQGQKAAA